MQELTDGAIKVLFISPEKLLTNGFQRFMLDHVIRRNSTNKVLSDLSPPPSSASSSSAGISLVVIDEVHCVAEWSHNFRNSYSRLGHVLANVLAVPRILGLTATATRMTQNQVCHNLRIPSENIIAVPLTRENLILSASCVTHEGRFNAVLELLNQPPYKGLRSIIIYVNYKSIAESLSKYLKGQGFPSCDFYHAGLPLYQRHKIQTRFMENKLKLIIATCAFGMGLDKADIRGVIHLHLPRSFENYIQEIGRAGRDGDISYAHVMYARSDEEISDSLVYSNGVDQQQLRRVLLKIFDRSLQSQQMQHRTANNLEMQAVDGEDEDAPLFKFRHYVAFEVEALRINMVRRELARLSWIFVTPLLV